MDLNLLRVFVAVFEAGTATAAADQLFVTQSAVSQSLSRLRRELGDPLFQREGRMLRPTPAAQTLYPELRSALARLEQAVAGIRDFDPTTSTHRFRIALSELGEMGFLPAILNSLAEVAPAISVEVVPLNVSALPEWLTRGKVDLAIASTPPQGDFVGELVKSEHYVLLLSEAHPLARRARINRQQFLGAPHVVATGDSAAPEIDSLLARAGLHITPSLVVSHLSALPRLLHPGPRVAIVPASLAEDWVEAWPLVARPLPVEIDPVEVRLYARSTSNESSALRWFQRTVKDAIRSAPKHFGSPLDTH